ncbi:MAG: right-handed parallel beta-helix repeat-containing protein, partial [Deltaproteobacteria bacterium]
GNTILDSLGMGVLVDGLSRRIDVADNVIARGKGVGINLRRSSCLAVHGNLVSDLRSAALRLTTTGASWIANNAFVANANAGLELIEQQPGAQLAVLDNWFAGNGVGLGGGNIGQVVLRDNDLSDQLPRQFGGGFAAHLPGYLTAVEAEPGDDAYLITDLRADASTDAVEFTDTLPTASRWPSFCTAE